MYYKYLIAIWLVPIVLYFVFKNTTISLKTLLLLMTLVSAFSLVLMYYVYQYVEEAQEKCILDKDLHRFGERFKVIVVLTMVSAAASGATNAMQWNKIR